MGEPRATADVRVRGSVPGERARRRVPGWWLPAASALAASGLAAVAVVGVELSSARPPAGRAVPRPPLSERDGAVHVAGTGTALPLVRALAEAYRRQAPDATPAVVHGSIGSGGGLRAVADGVVDVGLMAIPEGATREPPAGVVLRPLALAAVAVAVHPSVPDRELTGADLIELYSGRRGTWSDRSPVVLLLREEGDSGTVAARRAFPGLREALEEARRCGRHPTFITDADMAQALESTPGAIGFHDAGSIHLEGRAVVEASLDGARPSRAGLEEGRYPVRRVLLLVLPERPRPETRRLVSFVGSDLGRGVIEAAGYVPLPRGPAGEPG